MKQTLDVNKWRHARRLPSDRSMKIALVTTMWKRPRLTKLMLKWHWDLKGLLAFDGIDLRLVTVGSEGWRSRWIAEQCGWEYVETPNMPLSDKFNAGFQFAKKVFVKPDAVIPIGSDDFLTLKYFHEARRLLEDGAQYIVANGCHFFCTRSRRAIYLGSHSTGGGRVLSRELLDVLNWTPYIPGALSGIDVSMQRSVQNHFRSDRFSTTGPQRLINTNPGSEAMLIGIKSGLNLWSYERMAQSITSRPVELDFLDALGRTGRKLRDFEPWRNWWWQRRYRELDLSTSL